MLRIRIEEVPRNTMPEEHRDRAARFAQLLRDTGYACVTTVDEVPQCGLWLRDGTDLPCLVVGRDELGNWSVMVRDGGVRQYLQDEVE